MYLDDIIAIIVIGTLSVFVIVLRLGFRHWLYGVKSNRTTQEWTAITFPLAITLSLIVGWGILGNRWIAFLPVSFVAWGDSAAGLTRDTLWVDRPASIWPLLVMLAVCLGAGVLCQPYWIGAVGAVVGTVAERYRTKRLRFWDDNLNIVCFSLLTIGLLEWLTA